MTGTEERLATGDAVNVAARLEQAAQPGRGPARRGDATCSCARAVEAEAASPLEAKGKAQPLTAYRLVSRASGGARAPPRRADGRPRAPATAPRAARSRTSSASARATCSRSSGRPASGSRGSSRSSWPVSTARTVVRGRCLSYGEGITLLAGDRGRQAAARRRGAASTGPLASILGDGSAASSPEEIAWAVRKLLESRAAERPLIVRLRRRPLGRADVPRSRRARRRPEPRRADPAALHGAAGAARRPAGLGRRQAERDQRPPRAARPDETGELIDRARRTRSRTGCAARILEAAGGQPALRRGDGRDGRRAETPR